MSCFFGHGSKYNKNGFWDGRSLDLVFKAVFCNPGHVLSEISLKSKGFIRAGRMIPLTNCSLTIAWKVYNSNRLSIFLKFELYTGMFRTEKHFLALL